MSKEPVLETERLILRPITIDDAEAVYQWASDERVTKYMSYPTHTDISRTKAWIKSTFTDETEWNWAFVLKSENRVIGTGSIGKSNYLEGYWGFGYNLHFDYWHNGYCTEATKAIIDYAHSKLGVNKVCACHAVDNPRSGRVMEKCGLTFDHFGTYSKFDGSKKFKCKYYTLEF